MTRPVQTAKQKPNTVEALKRERDRFVALAFCAADVLIEADTNCRITYAAGATVAITGYPSDQIIGDSLLDIIAPDDRPILSEMIHGMTVGKRLKPMAVRLVGPRGITPKLMLTGYVLPNLPKSLFFALRPAAEGDQAGEPGSKEIDRETGLFKTQPFLNRAAKRVAGAKAGNEEIELTMLRLENFAGLGESLGVKAREQLLKTVAACLKVTAAPGDTVARFDDENYGLLHAPDADIDDLKSRIEGHLKAANPSGTRVAVATGTVPTDIANVGADDFIKTRGAGVGEDVELSRHSFRGQL